MTFFKKNSELRLQIVNLREENRKKEVPCPILNFQCMFSVKCKLYSVQCNVYILQ